jgi:threonine/homoserine/homoserine lactone efflux protein
MLEALLTGLSLGLLLAVSIGPIIFAIIKQSLNYGKKGGFLFIAGVSFSDVFLVLVCNVLSSFFQSALKHQTIIGVCGSVLLLTMGFYTLFLKKALKENDTLTEKIIFSKGRQIGIFLSGFFMNILNPGVFVFWLFTTAKVQVQAQGQSNPNFYLFLVYATCLLFVLSTDIAKVFLAGKIRTKLTTKNLHIFNRISGLILVIFGFALGYATLTYKVMEH